MCTGSGGGCQIGDSVGHARQLQSGGCLRVSPRARGLVLSRPLGSGCTLTNNLRNIRRYVEVGTV